jgi:anti-anti-sigma factor
MHLASGSDHEQPTAELEIKQGYAILNLRGRLSMDSLDILQPVVQQALAVSPHILAYLEQIEIFDSIAIGVLLELGNQANFNGGELSLAAVSPRIQRILATLMLKHNFRIYPDVDSYLAEMASKKSGTPNTATWWIPGPTGFQIWSVIKGSRTLDEWTSPALIDASENSLNANPFLIIDLSETACLTCSGLAALNLVHQKALNLRGGLRVVNYSKDVLRVIKLAHYDRLLPLYNDFSLAVL